MFIALSLLPTAIRAEFRADALIRSSAACPAKWQVARA
jgi:hypothetical protein